MSPGQDLLGRVRTLVAHEQPVPGARSGVAGELQRLCRASVRAIPAWGAGVSLIGTDGSGSVAAASDPSSERVDELQFVLGEGPCLGAWSDGRPVLEPDLGSVVGDRYPVYARSAMEQGVNAVFAFPLTVGRSRLGAFDVYRSDRGALSERTLALSMAFAAVAVETLLRGQEQAANGELPAGLDESVGQRHVLHQAQGMVMYDLRTTLDEAMLRIRAHAFAHGRRIDDVAREIVDGTLRIEP